MILNHLWGLYAHPREEWQTIDKNKESMRYSIMHIMLVALIPCVCGYFSSVHIGWKLGNRDPFMLTSDSALLISGLMYLALILGVGLLAYLAKILGQAFEADVTFTQAAELAVYTATPIFMVGFAALYPVLWFVMLVGLAGIAYSVYLLYSGVPILLHIPEEKGFIYASSVVTCGLVLLVIIMATTAIVWTQGYGPMFTQ